MKSRSMPIDQCKMSIEARPLRVLYSKYNSNEITTSLQIVRPLGRVRKDKLSSSEDLGKTSKTVIRENGLHIDQFSRKCVSDVKMKQEVYNEKGQERFRRSNHNLNRAEVRETENASPVPGRSRTQDFQQKLRVAASRRHEQDSPTLKSDINYNYNKKVIHLPLFRINLKTYSGETEVTKTVARTRESLRKLMELHRSKMRPANLVTANIRNYEFSAPSASGHILSRSGSSMNISSPSLQPFPAKPMLKNFRNRERGTKQTSFSHKQTSNLYNNRGVNIETDSKSSSSDRGDASDEKRSHLNRAGTTEHEDDVDDSLWSVAIRPNTSLTLGSTMNQLDRVIKSPGSDELRELSEVFRNSESQPSWPSFDEMQRLRTRSQSRTRRSKTSLSRPGTVLNDVLESPEECWNSLRNDDAYYYATSAGSCSPHKPVLRYTSKPSSYKLDPIIVPSHTCTECTMCNIYQRDIETPCPPNSPMSTQFQEVPMFINQDEHIVKSASGRVRSNSKHEVMHISRINMNDGIYVTEDQNVLTYMKAKG